MVFQHAQQLRLRAHRHLANLVEQQRPAFGKFEAAGAALQRARECAFFMAKNFAFDQGFGNGRAIDGDERFVAPRTQIVDGARHQFLARAARTGDQHRGRARRHLLDQPENRLHFRRCTDQQAERSLIPQAAAQRFVFGAGVLDLADVGQDGAQPPEVDGLLDVVLHAQLPCVKCGLGRLLGGHHYHRHRLRKVRQFLHQLHAAHAGHLDICDHDGRSKDGNLFKSFHTVNRCVSAVAPSGDQLGQSGSFVLLVFDNQYAFLCHIPLL